MPLVTSIVDHALAYAACGWHIVPLHHLAQGRCSCLRADCSTPGKHPRIREWPTQATTDPDIIRTWWSQWPDANIGLALSEGLVDIETEGHGDGADNLAALEGQFGELPDTVSWISGGGGIHRLFRTPQPIRNAVSIGKRELGLERTAIDVRGAGGLAVLPPSSHASGTPYRWGNLTPDAIEIAELPPAWVAFLSTRTPSPTAPPAEDPIPDGQRNDTLARLAGNMRRVGMSESAILAAIEQTNRERCRPPLPEAEVARIAASIARYPPDQVAVAVAEGHWDQDRAAATVTEGANVAEEAADPGLLPVELLRIPGFVSEVMDHCLATAPYPNQALAFAGALALQSFLAGRKVQEPGGLRTNLYLLALAHSGSGKDWPRKLNVRIAHAVGLADRLGDRFASGEGLQDALYATPCMLFQTDEIDGMLQAINKSQDGRHESTLSMLLTLYTSADSVMPLRRKAGQPNPGVIDQPSLSVLGTAVPKHYYEALSDRMLSNGFFARLIVLEAGVRGAGQDATLVDPPKRVLEIAKWWAEYQTTPGNLTQQHPRPATVALSDAGRAALREAQAEADAAYREADRQGDAMRTAVWARYGEQARKLALLYAVSEDHRSPCIDAPAARWATALQLHLTRRMLFMAQGHVADNPFHASCLRLKRKLLEAPGQTLPHSVLLKRMKTDAQSFKLMIETLTAQGDLVVNTQSTGGRPGVHYQVRGGRNPSSEGEG